MIFSEWDYMTVFQDEVILNLDKSACALAQVFQIVAIGLILETNLKMFWAKTFHLWQNIVIKFAFIF